MGHRPRRGAFMATPAPGAALRLFRTLATPDRRADPR
jgi:hypothetical protein